MKLIVLIALLCGSINAAPLLDDLSESSPTKQLLSEIVEGLVKKGEAKITGWNIESSLQDNLIAQVNKVLESGAILDWKPDVSVEDNLKTVLKNWLVTLKVPGFDVTKSITDNVNSLVNELSNRVKLPAKLPKQAFEEAVTDYMITEFKHLKIHDLDVGKTVNDNVDAVIVALLSNLGHIDTSASLEKTLDDAVIQALQLIKYPGYSPNATLDDNVGNLIIDALVYYYTKCMIG